MRNEGEKKRRKKIVFERVISFQSSRNSSSFCECFVCGFERACFAGLRKREMSRDEMGTLGGGGVERRGVRQEACDLKDENETEDAGFIPIYSSNV